MSIISGVWQQIKHLFTDAQKDAIAFVDALLAGIEALSPAALNVVAQSVITAENTGGTPGEKFAVASAAILAGLTQLGETATPNIINGAIEAAVAQMNANKATTVPVPGPVVATPVAPVAAQPIAPTITPVAAVVPVIPVLPPINSENSLASAATNILNGR